MENEVSCGDIHSIKIVNVFVNCQRACSRVQIRHTSAKGHLQILQKARYRVFTTKGEQILTRKTADTNWYSLLGGGIHID